MLGDVCEAQRPPLSLPCTCPLPPPPRRHPNIVSFLAVITQPLPGIVTEYCAHGSLFDLLQAARGDPRLEAQLTWPVRLGLVLDAAMGVLYLHTRSPPIIHK